MDLHRGVHRHLLSKRQDLSEALESLSPGGSSTQDTPTQETPQPTAPQSSGSQSDFSSIVGGISSLVDDGPSPLLPSLGTSSTATSSTPLTHSSTSTSSSTGSTATTTFSSTSSTTSTITSTYITSPPPTPTPTSAVGEADLVHTSAEGTSIVYLTSTVPAASQTAATSTSLLKDPSLEGGVFALVGIIVLVIAFIIIAWIMRKRRRQHLERDLAAAVTLDPGAVHHYEREDSIEKHQSSGSSLGYGNGYGYGRAVQSAYAPAPSPTPAYRAPSPNVAPYTTPPPTPQQPAGQGQGGASLVRKFSNRKPVPPLLPNPTYDPNNGHVSIPPHFFEQ